MGKWKILPALAGFPNAVGNLPVVFHGAAFPQPSGVAVCSVPATANLARYSARPRAVRNEWSGCHPDARAPALASGQAATPVGALDLQPVVSELNGIVARHRAGLLDGEDQVQILMPTRQEGAARLSRLAPEMPVELGDVFVA